MVRIFNYCFARWWLLFFRLFTWLKVEGEENMPREGAVLVVSNHPSYLDPPLLVGLGQLTFERPISLMAWDKLFKIPLVGPLMRFYRAFPVNVDHPGREPYEMLLRELKRGGLAGIFPEGGRSRDDLVGAWKPGALRAAAATDATIVPISVVGARDVWPAGALIPRLFRRIRVVIHPPRKLADLFTANELEMPLKGRLSLAEERLRTEINAPMQEELLARAKHMADRFDSRTHHDICGMGSSSLAQRYRKRARELRVLQKAPR